MSGNTGERGFVEWPGRGSFGCDSHGALVTRPERVPCAALLQRSRERATVRCCPSVEHMLLCLVCRVALRIIV